MRGIRAVASFPGGSGGGRCPAGDGAGGQGGGLGVGGGAELFLQFDERGHRRVGGQGTGDVEDLGERLVALLLVAGERGAFGGGAGECLVEGGDEEFGVAERVADAVGGDGVTVVAGVADQRPARAVRLADLVGLAEHALHQ